MADKVRILLVDVDGERAADFSLLLKLSGYEVRGQDDYLLAANCFQLLAGSEFAFDLVVIVAGRRDQTLLKGLLEDHFFGPCLILEPDAFPGSVADTGAEILPLTRPDLLLDRVAQWTESPQPRVCHGQARDSALRNRFAAGYRI